MLKREEVERIKEKYGRGATRRPQASPVRGGRR